MTTTTLSLQLTNSLELPNALAWLDGHFAEAGADETVSAELKVVLDEQVANVLDHGNADNQRVKLSVELEIEPGHVVLRFIDNGEPFDPLSSPLDTGFGPFEERPVGGPGLLLMRELTDEQHYRRADQHNVLELTRYFKPRPRKG